MPGRGNCQCQGLEVRKGLAGERPVWPVHHRRGGCVTMREASAESCKKFGFDLTSDGKLLKGCNWSSNTVLATSVCCMGKGPTS